MAADSSEHYRQLLLERRSELEAISQSSKQATETVVLDQTRVGRLSRMDALQRQAMARESERRRLLDLDKITAALARLDAGVFGWCLRCDEEIAPARMDIDPTSTLCVKCAELAG
ncbi:MAG: conjugal transfer protein TraR [Thiotrichales bacterium]|nr:conjugal transfer protein TraR [Thiotrichales bacterium]|tara:strand:- start:2121 stop:2465 length:345 start_codon:yes stop_codon:yes gene_type:complete